MLDRILASRSRFPRPLNRAIDRIADSPMSPIGRLVARRMGRPPKDDVTPASRPDSAKPVRVLIAPVNYSGQGDRWARSLELLDPRISAQNMALDVPGGFSFTADLVVPVAVYHNSPKWQQAQKNAVRQFTHVLVEAEEPLFGRLLGRDVAREVRAMRADGIGVAFMCHGTDIRLPSRHRDLTPWSPYRDPEVYTDRLERLAARHAKLIRDLGGPVFVSTPDLRADLPEAIWCPVVVDLQRWATKSGAQDTGRRPVRVAHTPSSALMKGTKLIESSVYNLDRSGVIEYRPLTGVPSSQMPSVIREADIVLDQFRLGSYGVAACEAMAAGRVVLGHIRDDVRREVRQSTGLDLPIVEAVPDTVADVLRELAGDPARRNSLGEQGVAFVTAVHDGRVSAARLRDRWLDDGTAA